MIRSVVTAVALVTVSLSLPLEAQTHRSEQAEFRVETVASGLTHPWSIAFLPDGRQLVTERAGRLRVIRDGALQEEPVSGVPSVVARGQGGLLGVLPHPDFADNRLLFLSYTHGNEDGLTTRVARARLEGSALEDIEVIFDAEPRSGRTHHFAGPMVISDDG